MSNHRLLFSAGLLLSLSCLAQMDSQRAEAREPSTGNPMKTPDGRQLLHQPQVEVGTTVGTLPRLPRVVSSTDLQGAKGPSQRIIWPAPRDNASVMHAGTYTITGHVAGTTLQPVAVVTVHPEPADAEAPVRKLRAFSLGQVILNPDQEGNASRFMQHRDKFIQALLQADPDRFLYMFRDAFGQAQPASARPLGVWDAQTVRLRGHATGHYLSALAQAYSGTVNDPALQAGFLRKMNYVIDTLHELSQKSGQPAQGGRPGNSDPTSVPPGPGRTNYNSDLTREGIRNDYWNWGRGFISAYPPDQFIMLEKGATYGEGNHQVWAPYYTLHKILAGLLDCYEAAGNQKALQVAEGMGHWVRQRLEALPPAIRASMWSRYIAGEYGGMNETMAHLARITGDKRFLDCSRFFDNTTFFFGDTNRSHGLARNVDTLRGRHANQHVPQIVGALATYRESHEQIYYRIAENFWHICIGSYLYSIGGVAGARHPDNPECFTAEPDSLFANGFAKGGQNETCATYNLLKLTRELFMYEPRADYMDYYEQALYNHILASVAETNSGNTYHVPLNPGSRKQFGNAELDGFSCCNGTALESGTKLQDSIYFETVDHQVLYVNLFIPSTLCWAERDVILTQLTSFPCKETTRLKIQGAGRFEIRIRVPQWASQGFLVTVNGQPESLKAVPGTYVSLRRAWKDGDNVEVRMPLSFHVCRLIDQPNIASLFYGPVLLAAEESRPRSDWRPVALDANDAGKNIQGDAARLRFRIGEVNFRPFYETYGRYSVYLNLTPD